MAQVQTKFTFDERIFSDLYKEVYGTRPRDHEFYSATDERKQEIWDNLCDQHEITLEDERMAEQVALEEFNETVAIHEDHGAPSRLDAILWMYDQWCDETGQMGLDAFFYDWNLPWTFAMELQEELKEYMAK
jgi:hypothetical protein